MCFPPDQIEELKLMFPGVAQSDEGNVSFFLLPNASLPEGCNPSSTDLLLCPTPRDGYNSRLFFAAKVEGKKVEGKQPLNWNGDKVRLIERNWYAYSCAHAFRLAVGANDFDPPEGSPMNVIMRISRQLAHGMREDLLRPHTFAGERIGFARVAMGKGENAMILLPISYWGVPDDQYVNDPRVGARINSTAIRNAMQDGLSGGHGIFHVHLHEHKGRTGLSPTDRAEIPRLVNSLRAVLPNAPHGFLILTLDHALAYVWLPGQSAPSTVGKISIVGYPLELLT